MTYIHNKCRLCMYIYIYYSPTYHVDPKVTQAPKALLPWLASRVARCNAPFPKGGMAILVPEKCRERYGTHIIREAHINISKYHIYIYIYVIWEYGNIWMKLWIHMGKYTYIYIWTYGNTWCVTHGWNYIRKYGNMNETMDVMLVQQETTSGLLYIATPFYRTIGNAGNMM